MAVIEQGSYLRVEYRSKLGGGGNLRGIGNSIGRIVKDIQGGLKRLRWDEVLVGVFRLWVLCKRKRGIVKKKGGGGEE